MDEEQLLELIHYIDEINLSYGASRAITDPFTPKVREIEKKAMSVGLKLYIVELDILVQKKI